jgi:hypothetical protein
MTRGTGKYKVDIKNVFSGIRYRTYKHVKSDM